MRTSEEQRWQAGRGGHHADAGRKRRCGCWSEAVCGLPVVMCRLVHCDLPLYAVLYPAYPATDNNTDRFFILSLIRDVHASRLRPS